MMMFRSYSLAQIYTDIKKEWDYTVLDMLSAHDRMQSWMNGTLTPYKDTGIYGAFMHGNLTLDNCDEEKIIRIKAEYELLKIKNFKDVFREVRVSDDGKSFSCPKPVSIDFIFTKYKGLNIYPVTTYELYQSGNRKVVNYCSRTVYAVKHIIQTKDNFELPPTFIEAKPYKYVRTKDSKNYNYFIYSKVKRIVPRDEWFDLIREYAPYTICYIIPEKEPEAKMRKKEFKLSDDKTLYRYYPEIYRAKMCIFYYQREDGVSSVTRYARRDGRIYTYTSTPSVCSVVSMFNDTLYAIPLRPMTEQELLKFTELWGSGKLRTDDKLPKYELFQGKYTFS